MEINIQQTARCDFNGRLTMGKLRAFIKQTEKIPDEATIDINKGEHQLDGPWCIFSVQEKL